ncbi:MAG: preprotein translocase subunit SecY [Candidatus Helarchaeota archaeon]
MTSLFLKALSPLIRITPEVKPPEREVSFKEKVAWTIVVLVLFLIMSNTPLFGIPRNAGTDYFFWWRVLLASSKGTLMELGISPIVTAGLIMQMLAGSQIIGVDFNDPEDRVLFTGAQKVMAIILTLVQIVAYLMFGAFGTLQLDQIVFVFIQLFAAGIVVILLDELLQKGWGLGSGVSLFIAAGVCQTIIYGMFSPIPASGDDNLPTGIFIALITMIFANLSGQTSHFISGPDPSTPIAVPNTFDTIWLQRPWNPTASLNPFENLYLNMQSVNPNLPTFMGFFATIGVFIVVIWLESVRIEIPLQYTRYRGFKGKYPIKLLYVSNIPVILVQALYANLLFFSQIIWGIFASSSSIFRNTPIGYIVMLFANFDSNIPSAQGGFFLNPMPSFIYFLTPPRGLNYIFGDVYGYQLGMALFGPAAAPIFAMLVGLLRASLYTLILVVLCVWFAKVWIEVSGIAPRDVAGQILNAGLMVPGFRQNPRILEKILERYIPTVTVIGGIIVGVVAAFADFFGALGTGMGVLLTVGIIYQYYQIIAQEQFAVEYPGLRTLLGME